MDTTTMSEYYPHYPAFRPDLVTQCKERGDFMPLLFEWYKYVGLVSNLLAGIATVHSHQSVLHLAILRGSLNRCSRLMLATIRLAAEAKYGESIRIFSRLITETAVKTEWLIFQNSEYAFKRYLAGGLRAEVKLKKRIEDNVDRRNGQMLRIEQRMLHSINRYMKLSGLSMDEISNIPDVPDLASMYNDLGLSDEQYIGVYRLGSQYVHGTWSDLVSHYLRIDDKGEFNLRDHDVVPDEGTFSSTCLIVLRSMSAFASYFFDDEELRKAHLVYFDDTQGRIMEIFSWGSGSDLELVTKDAF